MTEESKTIKYETAEGEVIELRNAVQALAVADEATRHLTKLLAALDDLDPKVPAMKNMLSSVLATKDRLESRLINQPIEQSFEGMIEFIERQLETLMQFHPKMHPDFDIGTKTSDQIYQHCYNIIEKIVSPESKPELMRQLNQLDMSLVRLSELRSELDKEKQKTNELSKIVNSLQEATKAFENLDDAAAAWHERGKLYACLMLLGLGAAICLASVLVFSASTILYVDPVNLPHNPHFSDIYFAHQPGILTIAIILTFMGVSIRFGLRMRDEMIDAQRRHTMYVVFLNIGSSGILRSGDWSYILHALFRRPDINKKSENGSLNIEEVSALFDKSNPLKSPDV